MNLFIATTLNDDCPPILLPEESIAKWVIIGIALAIVIADIIALILGKNTISQYIQHKSKKYTWLKWVIIPSMGVILWHIFWGFPWKIKKGKDNDT